jgi:hypothetical protein
VDGLVVGLSPQEEEAFLERGVGQELVLAILAKNQVRLLKELFLEFRIPLLPGADPGKALLHAQAVIRAGFLPERIVLLVRKDADGNATPLVSRIDRRAAKVAFADLHLEPRNRS